MKTSRFAFLLTAALSLTALSSCGGEKLPPKERVSNVYRATEIDLGMYDYTSEVMAYAGGIIIRATKMTDRDAGTREQHLLRLSYDGKVQSDEIMPELPEQTYLRQLVADQNGKLFAVIANYDGNATVFSLCDYAGLAVGETIIEDIGALFVEEVESADRPWLNEFYLQSTAIDRDGNFIFASGTAVAAAGRDGKKLFELPVGGSDGADIDSVSATPDGKVYLSYLDYQSFSRSVREIDVAGKKFGDPVDLPSGNETVNAKFYFAEGHDAYYKTSVGVYALDFDETGKAGEPQLLFDFVNSDIMGNELMDFNVINSERMFAMSYTYDESSMTSSSTALLLDHVPDDEVPEKYVLELAVNNTDQRIMDRVVRFNRSSDEYRVKLSVWDQRDEENQNYTLGEELLSQRILSGDVPDIIAAGAFSKWNEWMGAGSFVDLNEMMKKDKGFDQSKVFMNVIPKSESGGKLYMMPVNYYIMTYMAKRENIPFDGWTPSEYIAYVKGLGDGQYMLPYGGKLQTLSMLLNNSLPRFVDRAGGTCDFDNDDFREMLEFAASQPESFNFYDTLSADDRTDYQRDSGKMYRDNRIILNSSYIHDMANMLSREVNVGAGEEVVYVGYPCYEGNGAVLQVAESYSVFKGSPLRDGAWEFVKSAVLSETTGRYGRDGFPVSRGAFDRVMSAYADQHFFFYYDGGYSGWSGKDSYQGYTGDKSGVLRDVTQADIDRVLSLIDGASAMPDIDQKAAEMIMEEVQVYFAGDKSLDETVKIIQSRVGIYLAEKQ